MPKLFDFTINVPLILSLLGVGAGVLSRFVKLETLMDNLRERFAQHEKADEERFREERDDRHDLRSAVDGRLRTAEQNIASLQARK